MKIHGNAAWVFPDNFDIDYIIGIQNIGLQSVADITNCLMRDFDSNFSQHISPGDILIGGKSFGYGHAHPQPMIGMRAVGIHCVIAESYTFPFYRSELASGMKLLICPDITKYVKRGDPIWADTQSGEVTLGNGDTLPLLKVDDYPNQLMELGGVVPLIKAWREQKGKRS